MAQAEETQREGPDRDLDVVLLGATGFTGRLTAAHLASRAPAGLRWAVAGRSRERLEALRDELAAAGGPAPQVVPADVTDPGSLRRLASATRVLVTTVGPYLRHGDPVVGACAAAGTDYLDLTGEPEFVDRTWLRHHATARRSGARLVHACGVEAVPEDLGVQLAVEHLPEGVPLRLHGYLSGSGLLSGGTWDSALTAMSRLRTASATHAERRRAEPRQPGRRVRTTTPLPGYDADVGAWVLPMPTVEPQVVAASARALPRYGPDFRYGQSLVVGGPLVAAGIASGATTLLALAQVPPARAALRRLRPPGSGPGAEQRERGWFRLRVVGEGGGRRVVTEVRGGDPGYGATSQMLAEAALCLAGDDLPETAGQVTTAVAMGPALRSRLDEVGITSRVVEEG